MTLGQNMRNAYRDLQHCWARLADSAFSRSNPATHDDMARGEFISAFISERGLDLPALRSDQSHR